MIVFDIESGRLEAPSFVQLQQAAIPLSTDALRQYLPVTALRLMTVAEAAAIEALDAGRLSRRECKSCRQISKK